MSERMEDVSAADLSLTGVRPASPIGYYSWAFGQLGRDPFYILVVIYIFFPYFSSVVVGDPVRGQSLIGYLNATSGAILAATIPFLGAVADKQGRRKPWIAGTVIIVSIGACCLWWVTPAATNALIYQTFALMLVINVAFAYSEVFHNAMLPSITPANKAGVVSGLAFSLGNLGGVSLMLFVLIAFALPGVMPWAWLPEAPLFGIDQSVHEHDRVTGPISGIWMLIFTLPVLLLTPDAPRPPRKLGFKMCSRPSSRSGIIRMSRSTCWLACFIMMGWWVLWFLAAFMPLGISSGTPYRCLFLVFAPACPLCLALI